MNNINFYTYFITWSKDDNEYIGLCYEFKSLSWLDETSKGALKGIYKLVADTVKDMKKNGEKIPDPICYKFKEVKIIMKKIYTKCSVCRHHEDANDQNKKKLHKNNKKLPISCKGNEKGGCYSYSCR